MQKRLIRFILFVVMVVGVLYLLQRVQLIPSLRDLFKQQPVEIENTAILVKEINNLARLITVTAYNEVAIDSVKKGWSLFNNPMIPSLLNLPNLKKPDHHLIIIGKGKVLAGVDLKKLTDASVTVRGDTAFLLLPKPELFEVVLNPSGFEIFEEKGDWTADEITAVKIKLRQKLIAEALRQNILLQAGLIAKAKMEQFLRVAGFEVVHVSIQL